MEYIRQFEPYIVQTISNSNELFTFLNDEVSSFVVGIAQRNWGKQINILDADGSSILLAVGLSLRGYSVYTIYPEPIEIPVSLQTTAMHTIKTHQPNSQRQFDVVMMPHNMISTFLTEETLQQHLSEMFKLLQKKGLLMMTTRFYDHLLQYRPASEQPKQFVISDKRYIYLSLWDWLHQGNCQYTQHHYMIQHDFNTYQLETNTSQHRAWRRAELNLALTSAGFSEIQYHAYRNDQVLVNASKV